MRHNESWNIHAKAGAPDNFDRQRARVAGENGERFASGGKADLKPAPGHTKKHPGFPAVENKIKREYEAKGMNPARAEHIAEATAGKIAHKLGK